MSNKPKNNKGRYVKTGIARTERIRVAKEEKELVERVRKIILTKEEQDLARRRAKERLPRKIPKSQRITGMENLPRLNFSRYFSEEVFKIKLEKFKKMKE